MLNDNIKKEIYLSLEDVYDKDEEYSKKYPYYDASHLAYLVANWVNMDLIEGYFLYDDESSTYFKDPFSEVFENVYAKFWQKPIIKLVKSIDEDDNISTANLVDEVGKWFTKYLQLFEKTYPYYSNLLTLYKNNESKLLDNIKATTDNSVKFNDTPQNSNSSGTYEGDNYITTFTKSKTESSSELNTKMMRLKEIQDHYKNVMADWVKEFECLFYIVN